MKEDGVNEKIEQIGGRMHQYIMRAFLVKTSETLNSKILIEEIRFIKTL